VIFAIAAGAMMTRVMPMITMHDGDGVVVVVVVLFES
jgi:hypothetical protein